jgi:acetyltransferase-like isoleucine patch superfamily enzyme
MTHTPWPDSPQAALRSARETPWKARNELYRILLSPFVRLYFTRHGVAWGPGWMVYGFPTIQRHRDSRISIGRDFWMRNARWSSPLGILHPCILTTWTSAAAIEIGDGVGLSGGTLCAALLISIGDRSVIGANCTILDSDFHPLDPARRKLDPSQGESSPVVLEADVFIGTQTLILKGARIGHGSVIGAGSVVTGEIPPNVVAAGNPARVIRPL